MPAVRLLRAVLDDPRSGPPVRYVVAGATVAGVYLATPLVLTSILGFPIEAAIPLAYLSAVCLRTNLQRHFVFRHVPVFALSIRGQAAKYVAIGAIQYPTAATATAVLSGALRVSAQVIFVCMAITMSAAAFLLPRAYVFHASTEQPSEIRCGGSRPT